MQEGILTTDNVLKRKRNTIAVLYAIAQPQLLHFSQDCCYAISIWTFFNLFSNVIRLPSPYISGKSGITNYSKLTWTEDDKHFLNAFYRPFRLMETAEFPTIDLAGPAAWFLQSATSSLNGPLLPMLNKHQRFNLSGTPLPDVSEVPSTKTSSAIPSLLATISPLP